MHPDLAPTADSFADPVGFARGAGAGEASDLDAALEALLDVPAEPGDGTGGEPVDRPAGGPFDRGGEGTNGRDASGPAERPGGGDQGGAGDARPEGGL